jgi:hypothetical protein
MAAPVPRAWAATRDLILDTRSMDPTASAPKPAEALRIFLVEDSQAVRERLSELLTVPGVFEVIAGRGREESVDKCGASASTLRSST